MSRTQRRRPYIEGQLLFMIGTACSSPAPSEQDPISHFEVADLRESQHFEYYVEAGDPIDEALVPLMERHFEATKAYLGFEWPVGRTVRYYKVSPTDSVATFGCAPESVACYAGHVISKDAFDQHELVHAYMAPLDYDEVLRPGFLTEGVAEAMSCNWWGISLARTTDTYLIAVDARSDLRARAYSGWFAAYLFWQYSPEQYLRWMSMVVNGDSYETIAGAFRVVYGIDLELAWASAPETVSCPFVFK